MKSVKNWLILGLQMSTVNSMLFFNKISGAIANLVVSKLFRFGLKVNQSKTMCLNAVPALQHHCEVLTTF